MNKLMIFAVVIITASANSQWQQTLNGISIWSLGNDLNGNVYAGSLGSSSSLYKSTNTVFSIAADSAGRIFAANFSAGLLKSTNGGVNFTSIPVGSFGGSNVQAVACGRTGYVYVGTNGGGLHRSTDGGNTFSPTGLVTTQVITIAVDRFNSSIVYAGTTSTSAGPNGFYRSTDYGATFSTNLNSGINVYGIVQIYPQTLVTVSTTTGGPVHRSTNGGLNWVMVSSGYVSRGAALFGSIAGPAVYIAGNGGVFYSLDNGTSFVNAGISFSATPVMSANGKVFAGLSGSSNGGVWVFSEPLGITNISEAAGEFRLFQNYPNPFNPSTKIRFEIPQISLVELKIFDALGRESVRLVNEILNAGIYEVEWNAENFSSGIYYYELTAGYFRSVNKMIVMK
jgi:Secretion system C-terminal sorting domain